MANERSGQSGWERWHDWQAEVFAPVTQWFCGATAPEPGDVVLDVACGTGIPSLALAERLGPDGKVIATDISSAMIEAARRKAREARVANIEHHEMSIAALGFSDASFAAVTCKDGLMFCPDPVAGAAELYRVLTPGGRCAISVWDEPAKCAFFTTVFTAASRVTPRPPPDPSKPGPFRLSRPGHIEDVLTRAGFSDVERTSIEVMFEFDSLAMHWQVICDMVASIGEAAASASAGEIEKLQQALADTLAPYMSGTRVRVPNTAVCVSGRR